ncbi:MAG: hypothetical protein ACI8W7_003509 [Gammaproteobacteria bacterium]|jgi:hypothetical protein
MLGTEQIFLAEHGVFYDTAVALRPTHSSRRFVLPVAAQPGEQP